MTHVIIKESLMGTGKSSKMIDEINNSPKEKRWIVVAPFLSECHRYAGTEIDILSGDKCLPKTDDKGNVIYNGSGCSLSGRRMKHPRSGHKSKVENIVMLVERGEDIVTTHAALKLFTPQTIASIKDAEYTLVIDESLDVVRPHPLNQARRKLLLESKAIYPTEGNILRWNEDYTFDPIDSDDPYLFSWEQRVKMLCDNGSLVLWEDSEGSRSIFMWEYPVDFLKAFDNIIVLTYLFKGSVFEKYLMYYNIPYTIERGEMSIDSSLINIVDNKQMNRIGERESVFSATSERKLSSSSALAKDVKTKLTSYFKNKTYTESNMNERLWTCLNDVKPLFSGAGYSKRHIPHNTKSVNTYMNTHHLAYVYNSYLHPEIYKYMKQKGEEYSPDGNIYALSELMQWIYRSRIRKGENITLYIPSKRMRDLLINHIY